jgi:hypothetical protein
MRVFAGEHRYVLSGEPRLEREAQELSRHWAAFSLGTFFWPRKKSTSPRVREPDAKNPWRSHSL